MKLKNFTDLNAWALEQWGDAELGDSRRTDRAIAYAFGTAVPKAEPLSARGARTRVRLTLWD